MENNLIIAIGRQFGSGGHEIGEKLAKKLGIKFYDKELAERENCVIVGRCADYILRDHPGLVSVFVHADKDFRAARVAEEYKLPDAKVRDMLVKTDKKRANYYNFQSEKQWGAATSYNLCIESSALGIDNSVELIMEYIKHKRGRLD